MLPLVPRDASERGSPIVPHGACGLALALAALAAGCGGESSANPCAGVDCSGHGTCYTDGFWPLCACEPGYAAVGGTCIGGDADGGGDTEAGEDGGEGGDHGEVPVGCGDGMVDVTEECDDGNDVAGDGCEPNCTYSCHLPADCEDGDVCSTDHLCVSRGGGRVCTFTPAAEGTVCDDDSTCTDPDACDREGVCTGPPTASGTLCDNHLFCDGSGDICDGAGNCAGVSMPPCPLSGCTVDCDEATDTCITATAGTTCRAAAHQCDTAETCDGTAMTCPDDAMATAGTVCDNGIDCDNPDQCDGAGNCNGTVGC